MQLYANHGRQDQKALTIESAILELLNPETALSLLNSLNVTTDGWCKLSVLSNNGRGYVQVSYRGANKVALLQEVCLWAQGKSEKVFGFQASHLCHHPTCTIPSHIHLELEQANQRRKNCAVWVDCPHLDCVLKVRVCEHFPRCIRYAPGFASAKDFWLHGVHDN